MKTPVKNPGESDPTGERTADGPMPSLRNSPRVSTFNSNMEEMSLQFQAESSAYLHLAVLGCVSVILVAYGVWQLVRSQTRRGLVSIAAAAGALAPALLIDGVVYPDRRRRGGGAMAALSFAVAAAGTLGVILVIIFFHDRQQAVWLAVVGFQVAAAVGVLYAAVYAYLGPGRIAALMALRCGAILSLMLMLFRPALQFTPRAEQYQLVLPVLIDSSGSMSMRDRPERLTRYQRAVRLLRVQAERLEEHFDVEWRRFGSDLRTAESFDELGDFRISNTAEATDIAGAIGRFVEDYSSGELAGMLLISDGIHNAKSALDEAVTEAGVPIYTAGIGSLDEPETGPPGMQNIRIASVEAPITAIRNNVTTLNVRVKMTGMTGRSAELHMTESGSDSPAKVFPIKVTQGAETATVKIEWRPADDATTRPPGPGRSEIRRLKFSVPVLEGETSAQDNTAELHVLVTQPQIRVLYVEGTIRPEYKFLRRRIARDPNVQFLGMVRISGSSFWSYGSVDGQRLDQLPLTDRDFGLFDVLILGDLDSSFLTRQRMARIRKFVNDGGGLLMLGGHRSFGPGGYGGTDIEAVLPVTVGGVGQPQETTEFLPQLTAAGEDHPVFAGLTDSLPTPSRQRPKADAVALGNLLGCVTVVGAKAGAEVLAVHPTRVNAAGPLVVLAVQQFGKGRTAALTADTTWRWYMPMRGAGADGPYQRFWAQMVRWLAHVDTRTRKASPSVVLRQDCGHVATEAPVRLTASILGVEDLAPGQTEVKLTVIDATGATVAVSQLTPTQDAGVFEATYRPTKAGKFTLRVSAADKEGKKLGSDDLPLTVATHSAETDRTARDSDTLARIADISGGQSADVKHLAKLVDQIIARQEQDHPTPEPRIVRLFYFFGDQNGFTALFLLLVALLTGEWILRRRWQLH